MKVVRSIDAFYPTFPIACSPMAVPCHIDLVEANGKKYVKTPFAMLDAFADDDCERQIREPGYFSTEDACLDYLATEYPWWELARPIMEALFEGRRLHGDLVGPGRLADRLEVSTDALYRLARGHKSFGRKAVRLAASKLSA